MSAKFIRKKNRLPFKKLYQGWHWYFVTICVKSRQCIFVKENFNSPHSNFNSPNSQINNGQINLSYTVGLLIQNYNCIHLPHFEKIIVGNNKLSLFNQILFNYLIFYNLKETLFRFKRDTRHFIFPMECL